MYYVILSVVSICVGSLIAIIIDHIMQSKKQNYLGELIVVEDIEDGQTYISARVRSQDAIDKLKEGEEVVLTVERSQKKQ